MRSLQQLSDWESAQKNVGVLRIRKSDFNLQDVGLFVYVPVQLKVIENLSTLNDYFDARILAWGPCNIGLLLQ